MDFNKIKKTIKEKRFPITDFVKNIVGMSATGFNQAIENRTLTIVKLEEISKALSVPMSYWWEGEKETDHKPEKEILAENKRLKKHLDVCLDTIDNLNSRIHDLEEQLGKKDHRKRAAG
ncbi:MAG: hypothetical protein D4R67_12050 [Bacteroidetes bacterium]|nr:MAG: hypothetical protein D4R67_12050 [Bacteroidota bacterium]